ncbi:hypothetical protein NL676_032163 [Syzygium grande]|nr:hypothetical protein NL676_032163 [Syzygium grande]
MRKRSDRRKSSGMREDSDDSTIVPEELLIEILKRLPVTSLCHFSCVYTRWRSLISDPGFIDSHLAHSATRRSSSSVFPTHMPTTEKKAYGSSPPTNLSLRQSPRIATRLLCSLGSRYVSRSLTADTHGRDMYLVAFDVRTESFRMITVPARAREFRHKGLLIEFEGCLAIVDCYTALSCAEFYMCILEDFEREIWKKRVFILPACWKEIVGDRRVFPAENEAAPAQKDILGRGASGDDSAVQKRDRDLKRLHK